MVSTALGDGIELNGDRLHIAVRQPDQALLQRFWSRPIGPTATIRPMPATTQSGWGLLIHVPVDGVHQLAPLIKLTGPSGIAMGELEQQLDQLHAGCLTGAPCPQICMVMPEVLKAIRAHEECRCRFSGSQPFHGSGVDQTKPAHEFTGAMALHGAPLLIRGESRKTAKAAGFDQQYSALEVECRSCFQSFCCCKTFDLVIKQVRLRR